jgi:hypothetical protein
MSIIRVIQSRKDFEAALIISGYDLKYNDDDTDWTEDALRKGFKENPIRVWEHINNHLIVLTNDYSFNVKLKGDTDITTILNIKQHNDFNMKILHAISERIISFVKESKEK